MNVNDVLTLGAEPLVFLDYFATGRLDVRRAAQVIAGIAAGCRQARCALVGGETAEMPSFYAKGEYDLAGFVVAAVERRRMIDGKRVRPGHVLIGLASSGLHSNGYSLARRIIQRHRIPLERRVGDFGRTLGEELLEPTRIYVPSDPRTHPAAARGCDRSHHRRRHPGKPAARAAEGLSRADSAPFVADPRGVRMATSTGPRGAERNGSHRGIKGSA